MPSLIAALVAVGAIPDIAKGPTDYTAVYEINDFGRLLLDRWRQAGAEL